MGLSDLPQVREDLSECSTILAVKESSFFFIEHGVFFSVRDNVSTKTSREEHLQRASASVKTANALFAGSEGIAIQFIHSDLHSAYSPFSNIYVL